MSSTGKQARYILLIIAFTSASVAALAQANDEAEADWPPHQSFIGDWRDEAC